METKTEIIKPFEGYAFRGTSTLRYALGLLAILYGIGFFITSRAYTANYSVIYQLAPAGVWGLSFMLHGWLKVASATVSLPESLKLTNSLIGVWMWLYTLFSFTVFDTTPLGAAEVILFAPILLELADIAVIVWSGRNCKERKTWHHPRT